ncbi:FAD-dependent oxidoreductase [Streptomyces sp. NPDC087300]|uniref:FAD-dependent oxidoreductase n=1 Tax=Streptomyces sp. NPDC087300 TaxID=3365780 RepID=UPI003822ADF5
MRIVSAPDAARRTFDVCVVGSGASGAITAAVLAERGLSVLVLEQGTAIPPGTDHDDVEDPDTWAYARDGDGWSKEGYPWSAMAFGGGTVFYGGISFRYEQRDLDPPPALLGDADYAHWGLRLAELEPHYDWVEERLGVSGPSHGKVGDYVFPHYARGSLPHTAMGGALAQGARALGLTPLATPMAISGSRDGHGPGCAELTPCTGFTCPVNAKADVISRVLARAEGDVSVALDTRAVRFVDSAAGRAHRLEVLGGSPRGRHTIRAGRFVLAANAIQSAALLLRSADRREPDGMGNSSGQVGRHLAMKNSVYVRGRVRERIVAHQPLRHRYSSVCVLDHLRGEEFPGQVGGIIYEANPWEDPEADRPGAGSLLQLECLLGDRPQARNMVRLAKSRDRDGLVRIVMDYRQHPLDAERLDVLQGRARDVLRAAGAERTEAVDSGFATGSTHLHGTLRAGADPATSVTDRTGRLHDYDNVWSADGATFPFAGNFNPTLTIQANARRIAVGIA